MVKNKDLVNMDKKELEKHLREIRMELIKSNSEVASGTTPKSPGRIRQSKKTIARILTLINKKSDKKTKEEIKKDE
ncbi:MAG: 50S ribosomal protein L29 [Nanoarchaeota archaeon]|nr:50S ribosomal protein L29 [Nanoarchaeota archaeon]